jgi:peptidyl-prolyl cis-trans isomerase D
MLRFFRSKSKKTQTVWWAIAIVTIVTFVGGFVFILGSGFSSGFRSSTVGAAGTVNGKAISRAAYSSAVEEQRQFYRQQYGVEPAERDVKLVELQAWRNLVNQAILRHSAESLGLKVYDPEIVLALRTAPPQALMTSPTFQTNGQFDAQKYQQALQDPNLNWAPFEAIVRDQLPIRKLQERLLASVKVSEPELEAAFRDANEKVDGSVLQILPAFAGQVDVSDADIDAAYEKNKGRFCTPLQVQVEVLLVPKKFGALETQAAHDLSNSIVQRVRQGEDFAVLARDYSEGPGAENGGVVDRQFLPRDFGTDLAPIIAGLQPGQVADPYQDGGRFMIFKVLERAPGAPSPDQAQVKIAQIVIKVRPDPQTQRDQLAEMQKLRSRAESVGLSRAATETGGTTVTTPFFGYNSPPPQLFTVPEATDWALSAKANETSPVFEGIDEWAVLQVRKVHEPGPMAKEDVLDQLRQIAEITKRVNDAKPKADQVSASLAAGRTLEQAGSAIGVAPIQIKGMTRRQPDGRIASTAEVMAALFVAPEHKVEGPFRGLNGWYFVRVDHRTAPNPDSLASARPQLTNEILQRRQQSFLGGVAIEMRAHAKVEDLRSGR